MKETQLPGPVNQYKHSRTQPPSTVQAVLRLPDVLCTSLVTPNVPAHALTWDFADGALVVETQEAALRALFLTSATSLPLLKGPMNTM